MFRSKGNRTGPVGRIQMAEKIENPTAEKMTERPKKKFEQPKMTIRLKKRM